MSDNTNYRIQRDKLIILSNTARELREAEQDDRTINEIIVQEFYTNAENTEFNTFNQWKEKGFSIKKGSKAFPVWGKKKKFEHGEVPAGETPDEYEFFPICYLFSNNQIEPSKYAENERRSA